MYFTPLSNSQIPLSDPSLDSFCQEQTKRFQDYLIKPVPEVSKRKRGFISPKSAKPPAPATASETSAVISPKLQWLIFENRIGCLPYQQDQTDPDFYQKLNTANKVKEIKSKAFDRLNPSIGFGDIIKKAGAHNQRVSFLKKNEVDFGFNPILDSVATIGSLNNNRIVLTDVDAESSEEEKYNKPEQMFGHSARTGFWNLYKDPRKFRDFSDAIQEDEYDSTAQLDKDPRFAYQRFCDEQRILPMAKQLIKTEETQKLDYSNQFLKNTSQAKAAAEAIQRLTLPFNQVIFENNSLNPRDFSLIIKSFQGYHWGIIKLSFAGNPIGPVGCKSLCEHLPTMKQLRELKLGDCKMTDQGVSQLLRVISKMSIYILDLSGNMLGQSAFANETATSFEEYADENDAITELYLNDNNLRWQFAAQLIISLSGCRYLRVLSLRQNLLGQPKWARQPRPQNAQEAAIQEKPKVVPKGFRKDPPVTTDQSLKKQAPIEFLYELLILSKELEVLDISWNNIDARSIYPVARGLALSKSIQHVSVEGNAIGQNGIGFLMNARNINRTSQFSINVKQAEEDNGSSDLLEIFHPNKPEGFYKLDMAIVYDRIVLRELIQIAQAQVDAFAAIEQPIEIKQCFNKVTLDGKAKWDVPVAIDELTGLIEIPQTKGILLFTFICDPMEFKKDTQRINKEIAAAEAEGKPIKDPSRLAPQAKERTTEQTLQKQIASEEDVNQTMQILLQNFENQNLATNDQLIETICKTNTFYYNQVVQFLKVMNQNYSSHMHAIQKLYARVLDRHNRFFIVPQEKLHEVRDFYQQFFSFSPLNPTGSYDFNLAIHMQREIAQILLFMNKIQFDKMTKLEAADRSQQGNKSCLRNERLNSTAFKWSPSWVLPQRGKLQFEFVYLPSSNRPSYANLISDDQVEMICKQLSAWQKEIAVMRGQEKLKEQRSTPQTAILIQGVNDEVSDDQPLYLQEDEIYLSDAFRTIADFIAITTQHLVQLMKCVKGKEWQFRCLMAGIARCVDYKNFDFLNHEPEIDFQFFQHKLGYLNLFSSLNPNGTYKLEVANYEQKQVLKMLIELCRNEGWACMTEIKFKGQSIEKMTNDVAKTLVDYGEFECKYECPPEKAKMDFREKLGAKFLGNPQSVNEWI